MEANWTKPNRNVYDQVFVGRQPIYNFKLDVVSYELLFRSDAENRAEFLDGDQATSQVLINSLVEIGLDNLIGDRQAYINCSRSYLTGEICLPFDKGRFVLEILEDIEIDVSLVEAVRRLSSQGYRIALDDFVFDHRMSPLLEVVDVVKVDYSAVDPDQLGDQLKMLREFPVRLLAEKVQTLDDFEICKQLGFELFQGFFLARPRIIRGTRLMNNQASLLHLLSKLHDPLISIAEVEELIRRDISLSYKLLRYANSSALGVRSKIDSIDQALILLGLQTIRSIVTLMVISYSEDKPVAFMRTALHRAKMCELLGQRLDREDSRAFFTIGLFSILDAVLSCSMADILKELPLSEHVKGALIDREGAMGETLRCTIAYEEGNWQEAHCLQVRPSEIRDAYLEAVKWVETDQVVREILSECQESRPDRELASADHS